MVEVKNKQIIINGKPSLIMSGEIHYFRLDRNDWPDRIQKLKEAGYNTVASYVPWICHETMEGKIDLEGNTRPELDLMAFIDLCKENDLYFILRPGPFIMAEMKNEGIPHWIYTKYPDASQVGWDHKPGTTAVLNYLHPGFLVETKNWYRALMKLVVPRLHTNGGNIIAIQLDNEIGMLQWVSNTPDLNDQVLEEYVCWLKNQYNRSTLMARYPFDLKDKEAFRSPKEEYALYLLKDLGIFMRERFAIYAKTLRGFLEESGVKNTLLLINIHGTENNRGLTFPIGISQLYQAYTQDRWFVSGSDHYLGNLKVENFQDLYLMNAFMEASNMEDQPLTTIEFECGDANYGVHFGQNRLDVSAADFKMRMSIVQGHRLINYYLFAGGRNYLFDFDLKDGNNRISFTGEQHGFAAPVGPEGKLNYTYPRLAKSTKVMMASAEKLAKAFEERDNVAFAFIPDYFMTEYQYPSSSKTKDMVHNLEEFRAGGAWNQLAKAMLFGGYRFGAIDIQNKAFTLKDAEVLIVPSAKYMAKEVQEKLVQFMEEGGNVLIFGQLPIFDMEGNNCTILTDALDVEVFEERRTRHNYVLHIVGDSWAKGHPDLTVYHVQEYKGSHFKPIFRTYDSGKVCAFEAEYKKGKVIVFGTSHHGDVEFFNQLLSRLGAQKRLRWEGSQSGLLILTAKTTEGERFVHLINFDQYDKKITLYDEDQALFEGKALVVQANEAIMLPLNVTYNDVFVKYSTAEVMKVEENAIEFNLTQPQDMIVMHTNKEIRPSNDYVVFQDSQNTIIQSNKHAKIDSCLRVQFK